MFCYCWCWVGGSAGREKRGSRHGLMVRVPRVQGVMKCEHYARGLQCCWCWVGGSAGGERGGWTVAGQETRGGVPRVQGSGYRVGGLAALRRGRCCRGCVQGAGSAGAGCDEV